MSPVFPVTLALYAVACALYLADIATLSSQAASGTLGRVARLTLAAAFIAHAVEIGHLCIIGVHPFVNAREVLSFAAWLTVGAYLALQLRFKVPTLGAIIVPVAIVLEVAAHAVPSPKGSHASLLLKLHIGLATMGVALFAVAAGNAAVFLAAEAQLKRHRLGKLGRKAPALETLDRIGRFCTVAGFPLFTLAMIVGALLAMRVPEGGAHRLLQPAYVMSAVAWAFFAALLVARVTVGWRGRRAAIVTLAGFVAAAGVLVIYYANSFSAGA